MVRHLLDDEVCAAAPVLVRPVSIEDSAQRVEVSIDDKGMKELKERTPQGLGSEA